MTVFRPLPAGRSGLLSARPGPDQPQGEGIAVATGGSLLLSSEGLHSQVLRVALPASDPTSSPSASPSASATASASASASASPSARTESHEDSELPETTRTERPVWPWFLGGLIGLGCILVLIRSLRGR